MDFKRIHVLLIEDNPEDIVLLKEILAQENRNFPRFKFDYAHCLSAGIERLEKGDIDVVVLDLSLPDSNGMETLFKIQVVDSQVPVVVMTGLEDETRALEAVAKGRRIICSKRI